MATKKEIKKILVVAAHPDDEVLGCGATLAKYSSEGHQLRVVFLTDGVGSRKNHDQESFLIDERRKSAELAANILGVDSIKFGDYPDNSLDSVPLLEVINFVEAEVANFRPDVVLTHYTSDLNVDHRIVNQAVITATRPQANSNVKSVLCFEIPSSTEWQFSESYPSFKPNWFVDITSFWEKKVMALQAYSLEMRPFPHPRSYIGIESLSKWRGATIGAMAAEAFIMMRHIE